MRKAHELWTASRVEVCKNNVAGRQFEAQRSAASSSEPDEEPDCARDNGDGGRVETRRAAADDGGTVGSPDGVDGSGSGDSGGDHDDDSNDTDHRTRRRLTNEPAPAGSATTPSLRVAGLSQSCDTATPAPALLSRTADSDIVPAAPSPADDHGVPHRSVQLALLLLRPLNVATSPLGH